MDITQDIPTQILNPPKTAPVAQKPVAAEHPVYQRNQRWAIPHADYTTKLPPDQEAKFKQWVAQNKVPWVDHPHSDYDMRGYYQALQAKDSNAMTAINQNDKQLHYPDTWKTPYHKSFSRESKYATQSAPAWNNKDQLVLDDGTVIYDEREEAKKRVKR